MGMGVPRRRRREKLRISGSGSLLGTKSGEIKTQKGWAYIRELRHIIEGAALLGNTTTMTVNDLPSKTTRAAGCQTEEVKDKIADEAEFSAPEPQPPRAPQLKNEALSEFIQRICSSGP
jgi:DNA-binding NtrC family response regulator